MSLRHSQRAFIRPFSKIGLIPDSGGTYFLPRLIGFQKASAFMMLGDKVPAADAEKMGMVYKIFSEESFAAEAMKIADQYQLGPLFLPPIVRDTAGKLGSLILPNHTGGANWPGGALDPETGILYVSSVTNPDSLALVAADPKRSDMGYVATMGPRAAGKPVDFQGGSHDSAAAKVPPGRISGPRGCRL